MNRIEVKALTDEVYLRLRLMIMSGRLTPGQKIDRGSLAAILGVSPTPIKEALVRLVGERFLEKREGPSRSEEGFYVPTRPEGELVHIFAVRAGLEGMAGRLAVERVLAGGDPSFLEKLCTSFDSFNPPIDEAGKTAYLEADKLFHEGLIACSGNPILADIDGNLGCVNRSWIKGLVRPPEETLTEHRAIIAAFRRRDAAEAQRLLMEHNLKSRDVLLARNPSPAP